MTEQFQPQPDQPRSLTQLGLTVLKNGLLLAKCFCGTFGSAAIITDPATADKAEGLAFFSAEILGWRTDKLIAVMGLINRLNFVHGQQNGYITRDPEGFNPNEKVKYTIHPSKLRKEAANPNPIMVAITGIQDYLAEYWGVSCCRRSIARWGTELESLNLVTLHTVQGQGKQSALWQLNVPGLLLMAEAIEGELKHREADAVGSLDMLPEHNANTLRRLSNVLFEKAKEWGRKLGAGADPLPVYRDSWDAAAEVAYVAVSNAFELFGAPVPDWFCPRDLAYEF